MFRILRHSLFLLCVSALVCCLPLRAEAEGFSASTLKRMSVFLSNFTEIGMMDFEAKDVLDPQHPGDMIRFGIWHNYTNNFKNRIKECRTSGCEWGSLTMDCKYVKESLLRYFGYSLAQCPTVENTDPPYHFDGKLYHFEGADGEAVHYARVNKAQTLSNGQIRMNGVIYNPDTEEILGNFTALARPHTWNGKATWAIINMKTTIGQ